MMGNRIDDAITFLDAPPDWLRRRQPQSKRRRPEGRLYHWSPAQDDELCRYWGRLDRAELAGRITVILQRETGDQNTSRSPVACVNRASELGLQCYNGEPGELCLQAAADFTGLSYNVLVAASESGHLPTVRRGKQRYVSETALSAWFVQCRERELARGELMDALDGKDILSKNQVMERTGLSETHLGRYLATGVIKAWKLPDATSQSNRGTWLISGESVEEYLRARAEGRLSELLAGNPAYTKESREITGTIRNLRRAGRVGQRDPLTTPKSRHHHGCFTVAQVASHVGLSTQSIYQAIETGYLSVEVCNNNGLHYAVAPAEARRFAIWIESRESAASRWHDHRRRKIIEAGLLTASDLAGRWNVAEDTIYRYTRYGLNGRQLPCRHWGRYLVFELVDVENFERQCGLK